MKRSPKRSKPTVEPEVTPAQVIAHLASVSKPASIREIAHALGLKHSGRRFLPRVLQQLERKGEVEERGDRYRLAGQRSSSGSPATRRSGSRSTAWSTTRV